MELKLFPYYFNINNKIIKYTIQNITSATQLDLLNYALYKILDDNILYYIVSAAKQVYILDANFNILTSIDKKSNSIITKTISVFKFLMLPLEKYTIIVNNQYAFIPITIPKFEININKIKKITLTLINE